MVREDFWITLGLRVQLGVLCVVHILYAGLSVAITHRRWRELCEVKVVLLLGSVIGCDPSPRIATWHVGVAIDAYKIGARQDVWLILNTALLFDKLVNTLLCMLLGYQLVLLVGSVKDCHGARLRVVRVELGPVHYIFAQAMLHLCDALNVR